MNTNVMFSSKTDLWETPQNLFDKYDTIYHFETDVCALPENAKCKRFFPPRNGRIKARMDGRLKFGGCDNSAPFPSMIVTFKADAKER